MSQDNSELPREQDLLSSCLDEWGYHNEADNVRNGRDLKSYERELRLIEQLLRFGLDTPRGHELAIPAPAAERQDGDALPTWLLSLIGDYGGSYQGRPDVYRLHHWQLLIEGIKRYAAKDAAPAPAPAVGDAIGDMLRELLAARDYRTDGDTLTLAERCRHMSREDRDLISMQKALIEPDVAVAGYYQALEKLFGDKVALVADANHPPAPQGDARDADLLAWLQDNEFDLITRREGDDEDEQLILWWVVDSRKQKGLRLHSVSGHPLGSPTEAIQAAIAAQAAKEPTHD